MKNDKSEDNSASEVILEDNDYESVEYMIFYDRYEMYFSWRFSIHSIFITVRNRFVIKKESKLDSSASYERVLKIQ